MRGCSTGWIGIIYCIDLLENIAGKLAQIRIIFPIDVECFKERARWRDDRVDPIVRERSAAEKLDVVG